MFNHLEDLSKVRTGKQAVGFYIAYLLLFLLAGGLIGFVVGFMSSGDYLPYIAILTPALALAVDAIICIAIIRAKRLGFGYWLLALLSCCLAVLGGGLLGLIIPAYMTTRPITGDSGNVA